MSESLNIVIYTEGLPITGENPVKLSLGGAETAAVSMAHALARLGHRVTVYCHATEPRVLAGVAFLPTRELARRNPADRCDVFLSSRAHDVLDRVSDYNLAGMWFHDPPAAHHIQHARTGFRKASFAFFLSEFQLAEYEKAIPGIRPYAKLTTNGIDFAELGNIERVCWQPSGKLKFMYGARAARGLDLLLTDIWPRLRADYPDAELLVSSYDTTPLTVRHQKRGQRAFAWASYFAWRMRGSPGVRALGYLTREDFWTEMANCTAVLYPTNAPEVSCMLALEAQALGVPIVTSDDYALSETVAFPETRISHPWASHEYIEDFLGKVRRLVDDREFYGRAQDAGLKKVSRNSHSWDAIAKSWETQFREQLELHPSAARGRPDASRPVQRNPEEVRDTKVSATVLLRRDASDLRACLESLRGLADEVIVGDARSPEMKAGTPVLADELLVADHPPLDCVVVPIDFVDFAQARNELAVYATGEYLIWLDADETLHEARALRTALEDNVFFDAFVIQRRSADGQAMPALPSIHCFRQRTLDGSLSLFGCCGETVEHAVNQPPLRQRSVEDVYLQRVNPTDTWPRGCLDDAEAARLIAKDRHDNPNRMAGYLMGMQHYLSAAKSELSACQQMTSRAYHALNFAFEIWHEHVAASAEPFREFGFRLSREILALMTRFRCRLRMTREFPIETKVSITVQKLGGTPHETDVRVLCAGPSEIKQILGQSLEHLFFELHEETDDAPAAFEDVGQFACRPRSLAPELFELAAFEDTLSPKE